MIISSFVDDVKMYVAEDIVLIYGSQKRTKSEDCWKDGVAWKNRCTRIVGKIDGCYCTSTTLCGRNDSDDSFRERGCRDCDSYTDFNHASSDDGYFEQKDGNGLGTGCAKLESKCGRHFRAETYSVAISQKAMCEPILDKRTCVSSE